MADKFQEAIASIRAQTTPEDQLPEKSLVGQISGIPRSIIESTTNVFGVPKSPQQEIYERQYPVTSFLSGLVGVGGEYGLALKGLEKIKPVMKVIDSIGDVAKAPIKTAMARDAAKLAVVEAGRVAGSQVVGDKSLGDEVGESAVNIGFGAGLGGLAKAVAGGGAAADPLQVIFKDINLDAPVQSQLRQMKAAIAAGTIDPKYSSDASNRLAKMKDLVRVETANKGSRYVNPTLNNDDPQTLNRIFNVFGKKEALTRQRFARTQDGGFKSDQAWQAALAKAQMPVDWEDFTQYPRHITANSEASATMLQNMVGKDMTKASDDWHLTQEKNNGLFVMAKKLEGEPAVGKPGDKWLLMKTDQPGKFLPAHDQWSGAVADQMGFLAKEAPLPEKVAPIFDSVRDFSSMVGLRRLIDMNPGKGTVADFAARVGKVLGADNLAKGSGELTKRVKDFVVNYMAPTVQQFGRSPRAGRVMSIAQSAYDSAESQMRKIVYGDKSLDPSKSSLAQILGKDTSIESDSIRKMIDGLSEKDVNDFWGLWRKSIPQEGIDAMYAEGKISSSVKDFASNLNRIDDDLSKQIIATEDATQGKSTFQAMRGHFGISRTWDGDLRVALRGDDGKLLAVAAGQSRVSAQKEAARLQKVLEGEGVSSRVAENFDITNTQKLPKDLALAVNNPAFLAERQNVKGYNFYDKPFNKQQLLESYASNVRKRTKYMANQTVNSLLADEIAKVQIEDPAMHRILVGRLNDLAGQRSAAAKMQEELVDSVLSPVLGKNSASKIVAATNTAMWHLELGGLRLAYPLMNAMTFMQTVLPEAAFVLNAHPETLAKYYTPFTIAGTSKVAPGGVLNPLKLWWQATRNMTKKDPEFTKHLERGLNEGVVDPRFVEEWTGSNATRVSDLKGAISGPNGFASWVKALSEFLPAQSEKFSRGNAFSMGYLMGKDILGLKDTDQLYSFAKNFTDRTMYRYGMESRPRIFTTPAGSALGLFKNWMMHYMGTMLDYTGEGVMHNNWAPLLWQSAGTAALGGISALPFYGVANALSGSKSLLTKGYDFFNPHNEAGAEHMSDGLFFGLPAYLTGKSLSSQAASPLNQPLRDVTQLFNFAQLSRLNSAQKAFSGAVDNWLTKGENPFADGNTRDQFIRAFAPKTLYRAMQAAEEVGIKSMDTSYPIMKDVGLGDRVAFAFGFNPVELEKAYAVSDELWKDQNNVRGAVARYGEALFHAYQDHDLATVKNIIQRATVDGVDISSITRSAMSRQAKAEADIVTRQFKPEEIEARLNVLGPNYKPPMKHKPVASNDNSQTTAKAG